MSCTQISLDLGTKPWPQCFRERTEELNSRDYNDAVYQYTSTTEKGSNVVFREVRRRDTEDDDTTVSLILRDIEMEINTSRGYCSGGSSLTISKLLPEKVTLYSASQYSAMGMTSDPKPKQDGEKNAAKQELEKIAKLEGLEFSKFVSSLPGPFPQSVADLFKR